MGFPYLPKNVCWFLSESKFPFLLHSFPFKLVSKRLRKWAALCVGVALDGLQLLLLAARETLTFWQLVSTLPLVGGMGGGAEGSKVVSRIRQNCGRESSKAPQSEEQVIMPKSKR